jgi:signal transduction histidine kinase
MINRLSIFTKLLLLVIFIGIIINILVLGFIELEMDNFRTNTLEKQLDGYTNYIIKDIGSPPSFSRAKAISKELGLGIRYHSPTIKFTTSKDIPTIDRLYPELEEDDNSGVYNNNLFQIVYKQDSHFIFFITTENNYWTIILLVIVVTIVLIVAYLIIKNILKPINWLIEGVSHVSRGDLDHQVPVRGSDQLGRLAKSFNHMSTKVRHMIKSREQLLLDVSHELRSPITRIKLALEFIPDTETKNSIDEDIVHLEKMVIELLEAERLKSDYGKLKLAVIDLVPLVSNIVMTFNNTNVKFLPNVSSIYTNIDYSRMKIAFNNIIDNSLRYSKDKGVEVFIEDNDSHVIIKVKDYGCGILESEIPYIFEPFYRVDKSRSKDTGGYGLGMSLCKKIIDAHNGFIDIKSKIDVGTEVIVRLPKYSL